MASSHSTVSPQGYSPIGRSSRVTELYDPKAFIAHAASHRQAFAHCERFSTAASRRSLGSVSVPMWLTILSDQLPVKSLGGPLPRQQADRTWAPLQTIGLTVPIFYRSSMRSRGLIRYYHSFRNAIPYPKVDYPGIPHPFAAIKSNPSALRPQDLIRSLDLHALTTPPTFVLSQNQTLQKKLT